MGLGSKMTLLWIGWLLYFVIVEAVALRNSRRGDTLSEHVWMWFGVRKEQTGWSRFRRVVLIGFMVWLSLHFITGGWI